MHPEAHTHTHTHTHLHAQPYTHAFPCATIHTYACTTQVHSREREAWDAELRSLACTHTLTHTHVHLQTHLTLTPQVLAPGAAVSVDQGACGWGMMEGQRALARQQQQQPQSLGGEHEGQGDAASKKKLLLLELGDDFSTITVHGFDLGVTGFLELVYVLSVCEAVCVVSCECVCI